MPSVSSSEGWASRALEEKNWGGHLRRRGGAGQKGKRGRGVYLCCAPRHKQEIKKKKRQRKRTCFVAEIKEKTGKRGEKWFAFRAKKGYLRLPRMRGGR